MDDLIEYGRVRRAALGVQVTNVTAADAKVYGLEQPRGAVIQNFPGDSPARDAGLRVEDVIVAVDGKPVERVGQLQRLIAAHEPGEDVEVTVVRRGDEMTRAVRLTEADVPTPEVTSRESSERLGSTLLGIQVRDLTAELAREIGFQTGQSIDGVLVWRVARFSPAFNAGIQRGFVIEEVNGQRVTSVEEFDETLSELEGGDILSLRIAAPAGDGEIFHRTFNVEVPNR